MFCWRRNGAARDSSEAELRCGALTVNWNGHDGKTFVVKFELKWKRKKNLSQQAREKHITKEKKFSTANYLEASFSKGLRMQKRMSQKTTVVYDLQDYISPPNIIRCYLFGSKFSFCLTPFLVTSGRRRATLECAQRYSPLVVITCMLPRHKG